MRMSINKKLSDRGNLVTCLKLGALSYYGQAGLNALSNSEAKEFRLVDSPEGLILSKDQALAVLVASLRQDSRVYALVNA